MTNCWKHFTVDVSDLRQMGWGKFDTLKMSRIWAVEFEFDAGKAFNLWIDDVSFYRRPQ
ncbi:hypothetical protein [Sorangium sp. So ce128]|uniref:hypothetical protein n=1 Tax=Sorangium sp. So ce128 TaxID=3133281 RepID=UPI003F6173A6